MLSSKQAPVALLALPAPSAFAVVGIGASAGGLEALQLFLKGVPSASGMAYVIVQHTEPGYPSALVEVLQRATPMRVLPIRDQLPVQPDRVYLLPAGHDLSLLGGRFLLLEPPAPHGPRLPIDFFFRALAADMQGRSIGVILSGSGSDGTLGLRAIREATGSAFVQDPITAAFDGMARSAIAAGLADVVAAPQELAARVLSYRSFAPWQARMAQPGAEGEEADLDKVIAILRVQTGQDFSHYKKSTIYRRVERRMALHQLPRLGDYLRFLRQHRTEAGQLFKELLIGVTRFFRDPAVWEQLKTDCLKPLLQANPESSTLRAWTPACSTGEEAYTLAMVFREVLDQASPDVHHSLQIFATDLDADAIQIARAGLYPTNIAADVSPERLRRFFVQEDGAYRVGRDIRSMVVFSQQNVAMDPPFTHIDLLSCRNLLIYLEADLQRKLLPLFHYSLRANGFLLLGNSETVGENSQLFSALPGRNRLYQRRHATSHFDPVEFPPVFSRPRTGVGASAPEPAAAQKLPDLYLLTHALLLQDFAPAAVLTTDTGDIVYLCGKAGSYLEPGAGRASMSLFSMVRAGLSAALNEIFPKAVREHQALTLRAVRVVVQGVEQCVQLTVQPLDQPPTLSGMVLVVMRESPAPATPAPAGATPNGDHAAALALEVQHARDALNAARDEMQTSQEELKSSNEELQSTNEELQSANEELSTSKEEMQSLNEELQSLNRELTHKVAEMSQASDDMKNLLNSTAFASLFLDQQLCVRRFTAQTRSIFKLIASDVGRPITDLASVLHYPTLALDAQEVLRTRTDKEVQVPGDGGRWFRVHTMPYIALGGHIDGVVITLVDVTANRTLEIAARTALTALHTHGPTPPPEWQQVQALLREALQPDAAPSPQ